MKTVIKNAKLTSEEIVDIVIKDNKILAVNKPNKKYPSSTVIIDANNNLVLPGMVDMHVHMRDLNQSYKETYESGSIACAKNGVTTFCDMPNSNPATTSMKNLNLKLMMMKSSIVDAKCYIGLDKHSNYNEIKQMLKYAHGIKIFLDESTGSMKFDLSNLDQRIFEFDTLYLFHAEDENILKIDDLFKNKLARVHICHISSKKEYEYVQQLKQIFPNLTYEYSPHHLLLNTSIFKHQMLANVKPSLKSKYDQEFLLTKFIEDDNAIFATDHAPHLINEKLQRITYGFPGIDTSLYILIKMYKKGMINLDKIVKAYSLNPALALGLKNYSKIQKGYLANLIIIDTNYKFTVKNDKIYSKAKWSPFDNINLYGKVLKTIVNGKEIKFNE